MSYFQKQTNKPKRGKLNENQLETAVAREMNGPEQMGRADVTNWVASPKGATFGSRLQHDRLRVTLLGTRVSGEMCADTRRGDSVGHAFGGRTCQRGCPTTARSPPGAGRGEERCLQPSGAARPCGTLVLGFRPPKLGDDSVSCREQTSVCCPLSRQASLHFRSREWLLL